MVVLTFKAPDKMKDVLEKTQILLEEVSTIRSSSEDRTVLFPIQKGVELKLTSRVSLIYG